MVTLEELENRIKSLEEKHESLLFFLQDCELHTKADITSLIDELDYDDEDYDNESDIEEFDDQEEEEDQEEEPKLKL